MDILLSSLVAGIMFGMALSLVALGLTIIFGVMDIINFAHGEFLMIGMYTGLLTAQAAGIDPLLTLPAAALVGFLLGVICYLGFIKYLLRGPMIAQLLGTFGLMLLLRNLALLIFGSNDRALHHGVLVGKSIDLGMEVIIPATKLAAAGLAAPGTLYAAMTSRLRSQDVLLPLLLFPLVVPVLLAGVKAMDLVLTGDPMRQLTSWVSLLVAFDVIYWSLCGLLFTYALEEG